MGLQPRCRASLSLSGLAAVSGAGEEKVDSEGALAFQCKKEGTGGARRLGSKGLVGVELRVIPA